MSCSSSCLRSVQSSADTSGAASVAAVSISVVIGFTGSLTIKRICRVPCWDQVPRLLGWWHVRTLFDPGSSCAGTALGTGESSGLLSILQRRAQSIVARHRTRCARSQRSADDDLGIQAILGQTELDKRPVGNGIHIQRIWTRGAKAPLSGAGNGLV